MLSVANDPFFMHYVLCSMEFLAAIVFNLNLDPKYKRSSGPSAGGVICVAHCKAVVKNCMPLIVLCIDLLFVHQHQP